MLNITLIGLIKNHNIKKTLPIFIIIILMSSCSSQSTSQSDEKVLKDVKETAEVSESSPTTLAIESGSAAGTDINIPAGSLEEGSSLSLDRVEQPNEFSSITSSDGDGETTFEPASSAIEVNATKNGEQTTLSQPMTIAIPYDSSLSLNLTAISKSTGTLCVLHKSNNDGELYVFVNSLLQIDTGSQKAKFKTKTFGIFQMIFCGNKVPSGFKDAGDSGISPEQISYSLTVDSSIYNFNNSEKICLLILAGKFADENSEDDNFTVISSTSAALNGGSVNLETKLDTSLFLDSDHAMILLMGQKSVDSCSFDGDNSQVTTTPEFNHLLLFTSTIGHLNALEENGVLGEGRYG